MNRRNFLRGCAAACLLTGDWPAVAGAPGAGAAALTIAPDQPGPPIAPDFLGLSYESSALADASLFHPENHALLALLRRLGGAGVVRVGGNSSEFTVWRPDGDPTPIPKRTVITPADIRRLGAFVKASGWKLIYGLNLGHGTPEGAADEAAAVAQAVGDRLLAFQIGNEPDLYSGNGLRPRSYVVGNYLNEWRTFAQAVRARVPNAPFAGPDTAFRLNWGAALAQQEAGDLVLLTNHYYSEGPASSPAATIDRMLRSGGKLDRTLKTLQQNAAKAGLPFRMAEMNSCYGGGKYGVSDTLASALWGADSLFRLAAAGCGGVNFHGGMGGAYTPITRGAAGEFGVRPLFYAMLLFSLAGRGRLVPARLTGAGAGLTAYAVRGDAAELSLTVINADPARPARLAVDPGSPFRERSVLRLAGPALAATTGVTLGGATVAPDGSWVPAGYAGVRFQDHRFTLDIPAASAATVRLS